MWNYEPIPSGKDHPEKQLNWVNWECKYPWLKLQIDAPFKEMLDEAKNIKHMFVEHRNDESQGWKSICLHGIDNYVTNPPREHGLEWDAPRIWTSASNHCPVTTNYFKNIFPFSAYDRLRFMLVEPGGYVNVHHDGFYEENPSRAVNISLNNPKDCHLVTENGIVPFEDAGSVMHFNIAYKHCVINNSNEDRYHIIVHGVETYQFNTIVYNSYESQINIA